jgi:hypothetical protein
MTASVAEARIRAKTERQMRMYWPTGRIVHELQCGQGEHRLDLACITEDRLVLAEIKSERDVLKRAEKQLGKALTVASEVWLVVAEEHVEPVKTAGRHWRRHAQLWDDAEARDEGRFFYGVKLWTEPSKEPSGYLVSTFNGREGASGQFETTPSPHALFDLLWAEEMRAAIGAFFGGATLPGAEKGLSRWQMTRIAVEHMSGREIRRAVCRGLRARQFARADAPIPWEVADAA